MRAAYDEVIAAGLRAQHSVQRILGELLLAQLADNRARSTAYRMGVARFPVMKNLAEFEFTVSPVNQGLVRELHEGGFLATQRNAVLIGGTGTGKSHISIAIGANCVRNGTRVRFFTALDLVNQLEAEARAGKAGRLADQLVRVNLVILDELGYLPFPVSGGHMLFHDQPTLRAHLNHPVDQSGLRRMAQRLRRRQDDDGVARPADPPLRHSRNRQRELALQEPHLTPRSEPIADRPPGPTAPPHARRSVACEGSARRARVPSMDSGDDRSSTAGVGSHWTLIPGPASALIDSQKGLSVGFTTAAAMVHELIEARDEKRLLCGYSDGSRPGFRDDLAHHSDLMSLGVPR